MQNIQGIARNQLQVISLEDTISQDNPVRFIDAFVNSIDLEKIGFTPRVLKTIFLDLKNSFVSTPSFTTLNYN